MNVNDKPELKAKVVYQIFWIQNLYVKTVDQSYSKGDTRWLATLKYEAGGFWK